MSQQALDRYHTTYDQAAYQHLQVHLAQQLNRAPEDGLVGQAMNLVTDMALGLCGHANYKSAGQKLIAFGGWHLFDASTIEAISVYLRPFLTEGDSRLADVRYGLQALSILQAMYEHSQQVSAATSTLHSWQGRMAHHLVVSMEHLIQASRHLLLTGNLGYISEKLGLSHTRFEQALHEGQQHSGQPTRFRFKHHNHS